MTSPKAAGSQNKEMENEKGGERPVQNSELLVLLHTNSFYDFYFIFMYLFKFRQHFLSNVGQKQLIRLKINNV